MHCDPSKTESSATFDACSGHSYSTGRLPQSSHRHQALSSPFTPQEQPCHPLAAPSPALYINVVIPNRCNRYDAIVQSHHVVESIYRAYTSPIPRIKKTPASSPWRNPSARPLPTLHRPTPGIGASNAMFTGALIFLIRSLGAILGGRDVLTQGAPQ
ncbi:hypothetical protein CC79DRAFT_171573 [Sarocladium strictum]